MNNPAEVLLERAKSLQMPNMRNTFERNAEMLKIITLQNEIIAELWAALESSDCRPADQGRCPRCDAIKSVQAKLDKAKESEG